MYVFACALRSDCTIIMIHHLSLTHICTFVHCTRQEYSQGCQAVHRFSSGLTVDTWEPLTVEVLDAVAVPASQLRWPMEVHVKDLTIPIRTLVSRLGPDLGSSPFAYESDTSLIRRRSSLGSWIDLYPRFFKKLSPASESLSLPSLLRAAALLLRVSIATTT